MVTRILCRKGRIHIKQVERGNTEGEEVLARESERCRKLWRVED